jgi:hypothetical protein
MQLCPVQSAPVDSPGLERSNVGGEWQDIVTEGSTSRPNPMLAQALQDRSGRALHLSASRAETVASEGTCAWPRTSSIKSAHASSMFRHLDTMYERTEPKHYR